MIHATKWIKAIIGGTIALIGVLVSLSALGFNIPIPGRPPLRLDSDYSLYSNSLYHELKVPLGNTPTELLKDAFVDSRKTSSFPENTNLETVFFAQRDIVAVIGLTSKSPVEWLQLNPKMLLKLDDFQNIDINPDVIIVEPSTCGGGSSAWDFNINVKDGDLIIGNVINSLDDARSLYEKYDFLLDSVITLEPGEREVFVAHIFFPRPGSYKFSLGVEYWFNGKKIQQWTQELFSVDIPNKYQAYKIENVSCMDSDLPDKLIISIQSCAFFQTDYVCETTIQK